MTSETTRDLMAISDEPGKFENEPALTELLYDRSDEASDELGDVETFGHFMIFFSLDRDEDELGGSIGDTRAAILYTNSDGFVSGVYYESNDAAQFSWTKLEESWARACDGFANDE